MAFRNGKEKRDWEKLQSESDKITNPTVKNEVISILNEANKADDKVKLDAVERFVSTTRNNQVRAWFRKQGLSL